MQKLSVIVTRLTGCQRLINSTSAGLPRRPLNCTRALATAQPREPIAEDWSGEGLEQHEELEEKRERPPMREVLDWSGEGAEQYEEVEVEVRQRRPPETVPDWSGEGAEQYQEPEDLPEPREILDLELPKPIDPVADKIYGGGGGGGDGGGRRPGGMGDRMERMAGRAGDAVEMRAETFGVSRDAGTGNAMYGNEGAYHMGNFPAMDGMFHRTTVATSVRGGQATATKVVNMTAQRWRNPAHVVEEDWGPPLAVNPPVLPPEEMPADPIFMVGPNVLAARDDILEAIERERKK